MRPFSLEGKLAALLVAAAATGISIFVLLSRWWQSAWLAAGLAALLVVPLALFAARAAAAPLGGLLRVLGGSVASFRDGDFSVSLAADRRDELGDLVRSHNELGRVLREERQHLFQRELLLDTVVQNSPTALLLIDAREHIVYSNLAARALLNGGQRMNGLDFAAIVAESPPELAAALASRQDRLFSVTLDNDEETFHLSQREVRLHGREHRLLQVKRLTRELSRQEVQTWKKVIRVISHELNNSLAPIASLAHSGNELLRRSRHARLEQVFATIEERARHLESFIRGYARFAKLPQPQLQRVEWAALLATLQHQVAFQVDLHQPDLRGQVDPAQMEQALLNVLKNSHDACAGLSMEQADIRVRVIPLPGCTRIEILDRGPGMSEAVLQHALIPFYSTKRNGTGLGLALTREIVEAHGGRLSLQNRRDGGLCVAVQLPLRG